MIVDGLTALLVLTALGALVLAYLLLRSRLSTGNRKISEAKFLLALIRLNDQYLGKGEIRRCEELQTKFDKLYNKRNTNIGIKELIHTTQSLIELCAEIRTFETEVRISIDMRKNRRRRSKSWE